ncbi:MAG: hypothetical protein BWX70_03263 [Verrucomicrobia bacterium ADurb.Bin070]|nr:MAG: hypothetical protein BWX70_03263 [Verrucomicrobia bacterium ADurb.Bin070]
MEVCPLKAPTPPVPSALGWATTSVPPPPLVMPPLKVLALDSVHVPEPALMTVREEPATPSAITPAISPAPVGFDPCRVSFLTPAADELISPVKVSRLVPDWSIVAPPVVPASSRLRSVSSPSPI